MERSALLSCFQTPPTQLSVSFCVFLNHYNKYFSKLFPSVLLKTQKRANVPLCSGGGGPQSHVQAWKCLLSGLWSSIPRVLFNKEKQAQCLASPAAYLSCHLTDGEAVFLLLFFFSLLPELQTVHCTTAIGNQLHGGCCWGFPQPITITGNMSLCIPGLSGAATVSISVTTKGGLSLSPRQ